MTKPGTIGWLIEQLEENIKLGVVSTDTPVYIEEGGDMAPLDYCHPDDAVVRNGDSRRSARVFVVCSGERSYFDA